jgi:hypothetical protein
MTVLAFADGDEADSDLAESEEQRCSASCELEVVEACEAAQSY